MGTPMYKQHNLNSGNIETFTLQAISDPVAIGTLQGSTTVINFINRALQDLLQLSSHDDILGVNFFHHVENREELFHWINECFKDGKSVVKQIIFQLEVGKSIPLSCSILPYQNNQFSLIVRHTENYSRFKKIFNEECGVVGGLFEYSKDKAEITFLYSNSNSSLDGNVFKEVLVSLSAMLRFHLNDRTSKFGRNILMKLRLMEKKRNR